MKIYIIFSFFDSYLKNEKKNEKKSNMGLMYLKKIIFFNN